ncbi:18431_t:CDS:2 [Dentiscutata erythropus]|uniref:18431_t:CDS:1 n=1 Tax=Dentiscutata erythropus TaxID=1348616 RepID=A0A9N9FIC9_9GLOM|nr:18431_t:CDS:2 [Dentiscutata erythropus]
MELFSIGVPENTSHVISGYKSSGGYYAYTKPTDNLKKEALANILNNSNIDKDLTNITSESKEYLSDNDNNSQEFYRNFHTTHEILDKSITSHKWALKITNN